jgi:hypothetical protein
MFYLLTFGKQRIQYRKMNGGVQKKALTEEDVNAMKLCGDEAFYRLADERRARLERIGIFWSTRECPSGELTRNFYDDQWVRLFSRFCLVVVGQVLTISPPLYSWILGHHV